MLESEQRAQTSRRSWRWKISRDKLPNLALLLLAAAIAGYKFSEVYVSKSFGWDSAAFLEDGAVYAGYRSYQQAYDPTRPPFLPVVFSLMFRITGPAAIDGYVVSGILYFISMVGAYLLGRKIMSSPLALFAAVSYGVAPMVVEWSGIAYSNVEGTAIAALGLAALVYAVDEQSYSTKRKLLLFAVAFLLLVIAPLTRYTMGAILFSALAFILTSKRAKEILKSRYVFPGIALAILIGFLVMEKWTSAAILHGYTLGSLFPTPTQPNPFPSPLGHSFFLVNFPTELGVGAYGEILAIAFALSLCYFLLAFTLYVRRRYRSKPVDLSDHDLSVLEASAGTSSGVNGAVGQPSSSPTTRNALLIALLLWFGLLFLYYSLLWPYYDPRYSIEFIMPVMLVAFFGIDRVVSRLLDFAVGSKTISARARMRSRSRLRPLLVALCIATVMLLVSALVLLEIGSAVLVYQTTPVVDIQLSQGIREAATWVRENVPASDHIEGDWYTFLWWYLPQYSVSEAPSSYQLQTNAQYAAWMNQISANQISYVVYSNPSSIVIPSNFQLVYTSPTYGVAVFRVT